MKKNNMKEVLLLKIVLNADKRFDITSDFDKLLLDEKMATIGLLTTILHDWQHIHATQQYEHQEKLNKEN